MCVLPANLRNAQAHRDIRAKRLISAFAHVTNMGKSVAQVNLDVSDFAVFILTRLFEIRKYALQYI